MPNLNFKFCYSIFTSGRRGRMTVLARASAGVIPPDEIPYEYEPIGPDPAVVELANKLDPFNGKLVEVPSLTDTQHDKVVEANARAIWDFAREQAKKNLVGKVRGFTGDIAIIFDVTKYIKVGTSNQYTAALSNCRKVFARGAWRWFWPAVSMRVQTFRDQEQRIDPRLGVTPEEFDEIKENLVYIGRGYAYSAKTTSSKQYVQGTSLQAKREDAQAFQEWVVRKTHVIVKIARLNISDVPFGYCPAEIQAFEANPTSATAREALEGKLLSLQKEALKEYRDRKKAGTLAAFSFEEWVAGK